MGTGPWVGDWGGGDGRGGGGGLQGFLISFGNNQLESTVSVPAQFVVSFLQHAVAYSTWSSDKFQV